MNNSGSVGFVSKVEILGRAIMGVFVILLSWVALVSQYGVGNEIASEQGGGKFFAMLISLVLGGLFILLSKILFWLRGVVGFFARELFKNGVVHLLLVGIYYGITYEAALITLFAVPYILVAMVNVFSPFLASVLLTGLVVVLALESVIRLSALIHPKVFEWVYYNANDRVEGFLLLNIGSIIKYVFHKKVKVKASPDASRPSIKHNRNKKSVKKQNRKKNANGNTNVQNASVDKNNKGAGGSNTPSGLEQGDVKSKAVRPRFTFKDVMGMSKLKKELTEAYNVFKKEGGNGILLYGPPGNGKTFIAEAFAGQIGFSFKNARVNEVASAWVNETVENIDKIFEEAKAQAPVVLFLDEADSLLTSRNSKMSQEDKKAVNTFLTRLSELNRDFNQHQVLVVAATNFLDKLDVAAIREGRFDKKVLVSPPDFQARLGMAKKVFRDYKVRYNNEDLVNVLKFWEGFSTIRLLSVYKAAARIAKKIGEEVDRFILYRAMREVKSEVGDNVSKKALPFKDIILNEEQTYLVENGILGYLSDPAGKLKFDIPLPRGAIFLGPPGNGKTLTAMSIAKEVGWTFLNYPMGEIREKGLSKIHEEIDAKRPVVVMIDEADDLLINREVNEYASLVSEFLSYIDGPNSKSGVFYVLTTNLSEDGIDPAIMRGGRLEVVIDFDMGYEELVRTFKLYLDKDKKIKVKGNPDEFFKKLHQEGHVKSNAEVVKLVNSLKIVFLESNNLEDDKIVIDFNGVKKVENQLKSLI